MRLYVSKKNNNIIKVFGTKNYKMNFLHALGTRLLISAFFRKVLAGHSLSDCWLTICLRRHLLLQPLHSVLRLHSAPSLSPLPTFEDAHVCLQCSYIQSLTSASFTKHAPCSFSTAHDTNSSQGLFTHFFVVSLWIMDPGHRWIGVDESTIVTPTVLRWSERLDSRGEVTFSCSASASDTARAGTPSMWFWRCCARWRWWW